MSGARFLLVVVAGFAMLWVNHAQAQAADAVYPSRPVRLVVPFPPGGTADALPRILAEQLSIRWGQPVVVENRPGAGGNIGAGAVAHAKPDGYTLLVTPPGPLSINQGLYKDLGYDPAKMVPISLLATTISVLSVRNDLPAHSVQDLIAYAKANPGKLTYASQGNGSTSHLTAAMFQMMAGVDMLHIPYKGTAPALADLTAGQVDIFFDNISSSLVQHRGGRLRIIAVADERRSPLLPEVPTIAEAGVPGFLSVSWNAVAGPEGLPAPIAAKISADIAGVLAMPDVRKRYLELGSDPVGGTPADTSQFIARETSRWQKVIRQANVKLD
jgi:tripartite-type tricarboxylate transporter receptor subunit TctC